MNTSPTPKASLKTPLKALREPVPTLSRGRTMGLFATDDPTPYCERCKKVVAEVIVGETLDAAQYLCRHCWGRV